MNGWTLSIGAGGGGAGAATGAGGGGGGGGGRRRGWWRRRHDGRRRRRGRRRQRPRTHQRQVAAGPRHEERVDALVPLHLELERLDGGRAAPLHHAQHGGLAATAIGHPFEAPPDGEVHLAHDRLVAAFQDGDHLVGHIGHPGVGQHEAQILLDLYVFAHAFEIFASSERRTDAAGASTESLEDLVIAGRRLTDGRRRHHTDGNCAGKRVSQSPTPRLHVRASHSHGLVI